MSAHYRFTAKAKTAELYLYGDIGGWDGVSAKQVAADLRQAGDVSRIDVRINSVGGYVFEGYPIYNLLKSHPARVEVDIDGMALSIASVIAMAGDTVRMARNAMFMIHDPMGGAFGTARDMRKTADLLDQVRGQLVDTYVARTKQSVADVSAWMAEETWYDAREAARLGFVDQVTDELEIAACGDLSKFQRAPAWAQARARADRPRLSVYGAQIARL